MQYNNCLLFCLQKAHKWINDNMKIYIDYDLKETNITNIALIPK